MSGIIPIIGNVQFSITLDPGVWIFDDRKIDLDTFFEEAVEEKDETSEYIENTAKHWEREIREGAVFPPTLKTERKYEKEKVLTGSFGIKLEPFIQNAAPGENASLLIIHTETKVYEFALSEVNNLILAFSHNGKPLKEDGPVHIYFADGSNRNTPIKRVRKFEVA